MKENKGCLTPNLSTHFQWISSSSGNLTQGKVYKIEGWNTLFQCPSFWFWDDSGERRVWLSIALGVKDMSYEKNLKKILE